MDHEEIRDPEWEKLANIFLRPTPPPSPIETEAFVCRVMARLKPQSSTTRALRWLTPALGFALAMSAVLLLRPTSTSVSPYDEASLSSILEEI
jgi:hypothetical protein